MSGSLTVKSGSDESRYRFILESMEDGYFETDLHGHIIYCNSAFCTLFHLPRRIDNKIRLTQIVARDESNRMSFLFERVLKSDDHLPKTQFMPSGENQDNGPISFKLDLLRDSAGRPSLVRGIARHEGANRNQQSHRDLPNREESDRFIDVSPYSISILKLSDGRYVEVNKRFCHRTGYLKEEILGRTATELNLFKFQSDQRKILREYRERGVVDLMECAIVAKDGDILHALISMIPVHHKGHACLMSIATDLSDIKATKDALKESESGYRTILETAPYAITLTQQSDLRFVQVNDYYSKHFGYSKAETLGRTTSELDVYADPDDRARIIGLLSELGAVDNLEVKLKAKDGSIVDALVSIRTIRYKGEECFITVSTDITQLKETQKALLEREHKYRNILMNMEEGYWEVDLQGKFTFVNDAQGRLHRCPPEALIGKNSRSFSDPEAAREIYKIFNLIYKTGTPAKMIIYDMIREDGSRAVIECSGSLRRAPDGTPIGFFGISRDITEKKAAEKELEKYKQHLEEMVRERTRELEAAQTELVKRERLSVLGQLTATVSHELRNPLGVIRSSNFYLQKKIAGHNEKIDKHFRRIEDQVALCDTIVADLLEYTRGRSVSMVTAPIHPWLDKLLDQEQEMESVPLQRDLTADLPPVPHDQERMRRVIVNLIDNARQAVKEKQAGFSESSNGYRPKILISTRRDGRHIRIEISDNGVGMSLTTRKQAFEPLFTTRARGTGIGLANVKKIISEHAGDVSIVSEPGEGTTISILLPMNLSD